MYVKFQTIKLMTLRVVDSDIYCKRNIPFIPANSGIIIYKSIDAENIRGVG